MLEKIDNWIHNRQHGFRKGLSCKTQICATLHKIIGVIDRKSSAHTATLGLSKVFDRVPHALLMQKLSAIPGIETYLLNWIHDLLWNKSQTVVLSRTKSDLLPVTSGMPQGSVLGPVLFLVYINDFPSYVDCSISLFADNTLIYQMVDNTADFKQTWSHWTPGPKHISMPKSLGSLLSRLKEHSHCILWIV